jgi:flavin reductase (DIM6/NTAB) family NADH-FMN oxidoreductase RutF
MPRVRKAPYVAISPSRRDRRRRFGLAEKTDAMISSIPRKSIPANEANWQKTPGRRLRIPHQGHCMSNYLEFDPSSIDRRVVYRLLTGSVVPRPIGWTSTVSAAGVANLAPFSFFTVVCIIPPMVSLTIARNPAGNEKHTLKHIRQSGEFCINVVTQPVWTEMVDTANAVHERDSAANRAAIVKLVQTADLLFIEAAFAEVDVSLATQRAHLTTTAN